MTGVVFTPSTTATGRSMGAREAAVAGALTLTTPDGRSRQFVGKEPGPAAQLTVHDWRVASAVLARGDIGLGEAYMAGWWESDDLEAFMTFSILNMDGLGRMAWGSRLHRLTSVITHRLFRRNDVAGSRRNIMAHYDLGNDFYALWLDPSMSYSSGIYTAAHATLENAQHQKYHRILDRIGDRHRVLEIGCGWGGFVAQAVAQGRHVTALTISEKQYAWARERCGDGVDLRLQDYRSVDGRFPAIVSIEMFEAVGERYWPTYFRTLQDRLTSDGIAVVQTISIRDDLFATYRTCSDYIRHHIFPGGMLPSLERIREEAERAGIGVAEIYSFGRDYARTLRDWRSRFDPAEDEIRAMGYDSSFIRGWRLYLAMCAAAFDLGRIDVHQIAFQPRSPS